MSVQKLIDELAAARKFMEKEITAAEKRIAENMKPLATALECEHDLEITRRPGVSFSDPFGEIGEAKCKKCGNLFAVSTAWVEHFAPQEEA